MSISLEIWRRASPSNRRLVRRVLRSVPAALGVVALLAFASQVPWAGAIAQLQARNNERSALAPLLADAKREGLTFAQVVVAHPAHLNKPVYWNVTVQSSTASYVDGRQSWSVVWTNPDRAEAELPRYQTWILARVAGVREEVVYLDYLGRP